MSHGSSIEIKRHIETAFEEVGMSRLPDALFGQLASYLELLVRWNARLNLTSVRDVEQIIRVHLVECAFVACNLPSDIVTLLDYGSGAGLPGLLIAACCPRIRVTLAEANARKASFLREAVRTTGIPAEVFNGRVDSLDSSRAFDAVSLRAVDQMDSAITIALRYSNRYLILLTTARLVPILSRIGDGFRWNDPVVVPNTMQRVVLIGCKPELLS